MPADTAVTSVSCAKTAKQIEIGCGLWWV